MQAGRLTPDDIARERQKQMKAVGGVKDDRITNHQAELARQSRESRQEAPPRAEPESSSRESEPEESK